MEDGSIFNFVQTSSANKTSKVDHIYHKDKKLDCFKKVNSKGKGGRGVQN